MQDTLLTACPEAKTQSWLRSIPACMAAPAGSNPKAWAGLDAADGGVGASPDMDTGGSSLVMGAGAGPGQHGQQQEWRGGWWQGRQQERLTLTWRHQ